MSKLDKLEPKLNILVAYPYMKTNVIQFLKEHESDIRFLLDSGAFTAWKANKTIHLDEYCSFIESLPIKPWRYFTLDVVGDPEGSLRNYNKMLERGFKPIPVFTRGEELSVLEEYYKTSDIVAIGGLVQTPKNKGFVKAMMKIIGKRKVHWLGFNSKEFVAHYKPFMCDSSSWSSALRFASANIYDKNGISYPVGKDDFKTLPQPTIARLLNLYEISFARLADPKQWKNSGSGRYVIEELTCKSWVRYQMDVREKLGTNFFLACASDCQVKLMHQAFQFWRSK
jgi:hypothetical protein